MMTTMVLAVCMQYVLLYIFLLQIFYYIYLKYLMQEYLLWWLYLAVSYPTY